MDSEKFAVDMDTLIEIYREGFYAGCMSQFCSVRDFLSLSKSIGHVENLIKEIVDVD